VSEPSRGVIARVRFNHARDGRGPEPKGVEHLQLGLSWRVTEILDRWERPGSPEQMLGKPDLIKWWLLKVAGPLPGRPPSAASSSWRSASTATRPVVDHRRSARSIDAA
jgi:hypothetical protein